jgi:predicted dehydrogenase
VSFCRAVAAAEPEEVFGWQVAGESGVDMSFAGQMRFAGGVLGQFDCSFDSQFRWGAEVVGSEGVLLIASPWKPGGDGPPGVCLRRGDDEEWLAVEDVDAYLCEVEAMADCVLEGAEPVVSLSDSRGNVATLNALHRSARMGEVVAPDAQGSDRAQRNPT